MSDRGMKKYAPFKALDGQFDLIDKLIKEKEKVSRPILDEDQLYKINEVLSSTEIGDTLKVKYFKNGHIFFEEHSLYKVDQFNKKLFFDDGELILDTIDILDLDY